MFVASYLLDDGCPFRGNLTGRTILVVNISKPGFFQALRVLPSRQKNFSLNINEYAVGLLRLLTVTPHKYI